MNVLPFSTALLIAVAGGVFFGLFSCGGYPWHKDLFMVLSVSATAWAVAVPIHQSRRVLSSAALLVAVPLAYCVAEALSAPFYASRIDTLDEYIDAVVLAWQIGPC